jgi:KipI family sensor histidine kinase inhibitor
MAASAGLAITLAAISTALTIRRIMQNSEKRLNPMGKRGTGQPHAGPAWRWVSERGLRVETGDTTLARYAALISRNFPEIEDIIPADDSLLLILKRAAAVSTELRSALAAPPPAPQATNGKRHEIAVEYGGVAGPDLPALAKRAGMSAADYVDHHAAADYTVAFLGFQPGFPYLRGLPATLHAPRRASPRLRVAAGSVAIGGIYTGIYPAAGPGGWHIIGRAAAVLFDPQREAPALLMPGDRVRFVPA